MGKISFWQKHKKGEQSGSHKHHGSGRSGPKAVFCISAMEKQRVDFDEQPSQQRTVA